MTVVQRVLQAATLASLGFAAVATGQSEAPGTTEQADAPAIAAVNPTPHSQDAERRGRTHYLRHCQICHGFDGRALENIDFEAADLTDPDRWLFGTTDGDLFRNTKFGAGLDMPPFEAELDDEEIWDLVHYLRSIGPKELRPKPSPAEGTVQTKENRR